MRTIVATSCVVMLLAACGGDTPAAEPLCIPGASVSCVCPGGALGGQVCLPDGSGFEACVCAPVMDSSAPDSSTPDAMVADSGVGDSGADSGHSDADTGVPDADAADGGPTPVCDGTGPTGFFVIRSLAIGRENPPGTALGFDLDGRVSDDTDERGCFQPDFVDPDGTPGVDNQYAVLAPTLESAGAHLDPALRAGVASGDVLLLLELEPGTDMCTSMSLYHGIVPAGGPPTLDASGLIVAGQTFELDRASVDASGAAVQRVVSVHVGGGRVLGRPLDVFLELPGATTSIPLRIRDASIRFDATATTLTNGVIGGSLDIDEFAAAVASIAGDSLPIDLIRSTLETVADLGVDAAGICRQLSVSLVFDAVTAVKGAVAAAP